jgi:hypothetical protein
MATEAQWSGIEVALDMITALVTANDSNAAMAVLDAQETKTLDHLNHVFSGHIFIERLLVELLAENGLSHNETLQTLRARTTEAHSRDRNG